MDYMASVSSLEAGLLLQFSKKKQICCKEDGLSYKLSFLIQQFLLGNEGIGI